MHDLWDVPGYEWGEKLCMLVSICMCMHGTEIWFSFYGSKEWVQSYQNYFMNTIKGSKLGYSYKNVRCSYQA